MTDTPSGLLMHLKDVEYLKDTHMIVGSSGHTVENIYFSAVKAEANLGEHTNLTFFDINYNKIGAVQVEHWMDNQYRVRI